MRAYSLLIFQVNTAATVGGAALRTQINVSRAFPGRLGTDQRSADPFYTGAWRPLGSVREAHDRVVGIEHCP